MNCLNCRREVDSESAQLSNKVLVCRQCHDLASQFAIDVLRDIHEMHGSLGDYLRAMLRTGSFKPDAVRGREARLGALVRWMGGVRASPCPSPPTPLLPPPTPSSGEPLPPHVATLAAIGRRSSSSPTE